MTSHSLSVEALLGVEPAQRSSPLTLAYSIERGLPVTTLDRLAGMVAPDDARFKFRLISKATLDRRRKSASQRLTSEEGDRLARLAKVFSFALDIYREPEQARAFLTKPHPMLDGKLPLDVALATSPGADLVINLLGRAAYASGLGRTGRDDLQGRRGPLVCGGTRRAAAGPFDPRKARAQHPDQPAPPGRAAHHLRSAGTRLDDRLYG